MNIGEFNATPIVKKELPEEAIEDFRKGSYIDWFVYYDYILSEDFIREFQDKVYWSWVSFEQKLSEDFIIEFKDKVDWLGISFYQKLSKEFIAEFSDKIDFYEILDNVNISEEVKDYCRMFL